MVPFRSEKSTEALWIRLSSRLGFLTRVGLLTCAYAADTNGSWLVGFTYVRGVSWTSLVPGLDFWHTCMEWPLSSNPGIKELQSKGPLMRQSEKDNLKAYPQMAAYKLRLSCPDIETPIDVPNTVLLHHRGSICYYYTGESIIPACC